jgi:hypothetical protein
MPSSIYPKKAARAPQPTDSWVNRVRYFADGMATVTFIVPWNVR